MPAKDHLLIRAKELAQTGKYADARRLVLALLMEDPENEAVWLCYADTFPGVDDRLRIYEKALQQGNDMPRIRRAMRQIARAREQLAETPVPVSGAAAQAMNGWPGTVAPAQSGEANAINDKKSNPVWRTAAVNELGSRQFKAGKKSPLQDRLIEEQGSRAGNNQFILVILGIFILLAVFTTYRQYLRNQELLRVSQEAVSRMEQMQTEMAGLASQIQSLQAQKAELLQKLLNSQASYEETAANLKKVSEDLGQLQAQYADVTTRYSELDAEFKRLQTEHQDLVVRSGELQARYDNLSNAYDLLNKEKSNLEYNYSQLQIAYNGLAANSIQPPYIAVSDRMVHLAFRGTDNSIRYWDFPFESLEESIQVGFLKRGVMNLPIVRLTLTTSDGDTYYAPDFRSFVDPDPFQEVMKQVYSESPDNYTFLHEVWFIVSQLTTYTGDFGEVPRMPLETLLAGGGDCEDTSILYASMVKAAPVDWKVSLVLMNGNNPYDRHNPNHVAVAVDTGSERYVIETTNHETMTPYDSERVDAWFYEID